MTINKLNRKRAISIFALISFCILASGSGEDDTPKVELNSVSDMAGHLKNGVFQFKDESTSRTIVHKFSFDGTSERCTAKSKFITEDNFDAPESGNTEIRKRKTSDTGETYFEVKCRPASGYILSFQVEDNGRFSAWTAGYETILESTYSTEKLK